MSSLVRIFDHAPDAERVWKRAEHMIEIWRIRFADLIVWMEETIEYPLCIFKLPSKHRKRMRTTNGLDRYHEELQRRGRVVRIFPNRASCLRLTTALSMEQSEYWLTGHRYLDMEVLDEDQ